MMIKVLLTDKHCVARTGQSRIIAMQSYTSKHRYNFASSPPCVFHLFIIGRGYVCNGVRSVRTHALSAGFGGVAPEGAEEAPRVTRQNSIFLVVERGRC